MISNIVGGFWIILGLIWVMKPQILKDRLARKMTRTMKRMIFGFIIMLGFSLMVAVFKIPGILAKTIGVFGMIVAIRGIMLVTSKASDKMITWWSDRSLLFFRVQGLAILISGIVLVIK